MDEGLRPVTRSTERSTPVPRVDAEARRERERRERQPKKREGDSIELGSDDAADTPRSSERPVTGPDGHLDLSA
ncbi:MAG: hypothetical protein AAFR38_04260 [Planctomycetota bacterium]